MCRLRSRSRGSDYFANMSCSSLLSRHAVKRIAPLLGVLVLACDVRPTGTLEPIPYGTIEVEVRTIRGPSGVADPEGYLFSLDSAIQGYGVQRLDLLDPMDSVVFNPATLGFHQVTIYDISPNCLLRNSRDTTIFVAAWLRTEVRFTVECQ